MSPQHGPYHRTGEPGGPCCPVAALDITIKGEQGVPIAAQLLDAGPDAAEVELLRTVARGLGVQWGRDEFGWWAVVRREAPQ